MEVTYKYQNSWEIEEGMDLMITDNYYFQEATPLITLQATCDGFYDLIDEFGDRVVGTYGVDSATIGIFRTEDCKNEDILSKEHLYTKISSFKGSIVLYYNNDDMFIEYLLLFDGTSNGEKIEWITIFN